MIYLAGQMSGIRDYNYPYFNKIADKIRGMGYEVFNPAEEQGAPSDEYCVDWADYMKKDIKVLVESDGVAVLEGWEVSRGATLEVNIARGLGLPVYKAEDMTIIHPAENVVHSELSPTNKKTETKQPTPFIDQPKEEPPRD